MCESATTSFGHFSVSFQEHDTFRLHFPSLTTPTFAPSIIPPRFLPEGTGVWIILESPTEGKPDPSNNGGGNYFLCISNTNTRLRFRENVKQLLKVASQQVFPLHTGPQRRIRHLCLGRFPQLQPLSCSICAPDI